MLALVLALGDTDPNGVVRVVCEPIHNVALAVFFQRLHQNVHRVGVSLPAHLFVFLHSARFSKVKSLAAAMRDGKQKEGQHSAS